MGKLGGTLGYLDLEMQVSTIQIYVRRLKLRMEQTEKKAMKGFVCIR